MNFNVLSSLNTKLYKKSKCFQRAIIFPKEKKRAKNALYVICFISLLPLRYDGGTEGHVSKRYQVVFINALLNLLPVYLKLHEKDLKLHICLQILLVSIKSLLSSFTQFTCLVILGAAVLKDLCCHSLFQKAFQKVN